MISLEEGVNKAIKIYGEGLFTNEGKIDCFKKFGYNIWRIACERYIFNSIEHVVPEDMLKKWKKEKDENDGIATQSTRLAW